MGNQVNGAEIFKEFKEYSVVEFFQKNRQMLGFAGKVRSLTTIVHEYTTNSVTYDTPTVVMVDGRVRIEKIGRFVDELMERHGEKVSVDGEVESVRGLGGSYKVLCFDKNTLKLAFKPLKSAHRHGMREGEKIFCIETVGGRRVEVTRHHSMFTLREGAVVPIRAGELSEGDCIVAPAKCWLGEKGYEEINLIEEILKLPEEETKGIGVYGVKKLLHSNPSLKNRIKNQLSEKERNVYSRYVSCDRLPINLLRRIREEERRAFYECRIGFRRGEQLLDNRVAVNERLARFLGIFTAEGSVRTTLAESVLSFGAGEKELIDISKELVGEVFGVEAVVMQAGKSAVVVIPGRMMAFVLSKVFGYGHSAKEKTIPEIVFSFDKKNAKEFLIGYLCGDGHPSKLLLEVLLGRVSLEEANLKIAVANASEKLAVQLSYLLSALGYLPYIKKEAAEVRAVNGSDVNFGELYRIEFWTNQIGPLNLHPVKEGEITSMPEPKLKWAVTERGQQVVLIDNASSLSEYASLSEETLKFCKGDLGVLRIKKIETRDARDGEYVYDYSVEGDENFVGGYGPVCLHNSLDACEEAGILPDILVKIEELPDGHVKVTIQDNGPGIPPDYLGKAMGMMLAGTKFHRYMQQRGQQGIGGAGCTLFSQITTGKATKMRSGLGDGKVYECEMKIDVKNNQPLITNQVEFMGNFRGLRIEAEFADVKYDKSEHGVYEYLRRTAMANPHAQITFIEPTGEKHVFQRASDKIPEKPVEIQPHPLGITTGDLVDMAHRTDCRKLSSFLSSTFSRMSSAKVEELAKLVPMVNFEKNPKDLKWSEAEAVVNAIKTLKWIAPPTDALRPIGSDQIEKALRNILAPEFVSVSQRKPKVYRGGVPFMVEAAVAYGGNAGRVKSDGSRGGDVIRYANRVPLMFDGGSCAITEAVKSIDWKRYDIKDFENEPITVFANFVSVHVPYTGTGKQAIVAEDEIVSEIRYAIMEVARDLQIYLRGKIREMDKETKKKIIKRYVKQLSMDLGELAGAEAPSKIEEELIRIIETKYEKIEEGGEEMEVVAEEKVEGEENEKEE